MRWFKKTKTDPWHRRWFRDGKRGLTPFNFWVVDDTMCRVRRDDLENLLREAGYRG